MNSENLNKFKKCVPVISFVLIFGLFFSVTFGIGLALKSNKPKKNTDVSSTSENKNQTDTENLISTVSSDVSVSTDTEISDAPLAQQPSEIASALSAIDKSFADLKSSQLVTVKTNSVYATITFWQKGNDGVWKSEKEYDGFIGFWGASASPSPDAYYTPIGLFDINDAFGFSVPETKLDVYLISSNTIWATDSESEKYYSFCNSNEKGIAMHDDSSLEYGFVIGDGNDGLNDFFLCCGNDCTQGRIAMDKEDVIDLLKRLDAAKNPKILIY